MKKSPRKLWMINVMVVLVEDSDFGSGFVYQALYLVAGYWYYCLHYYLCLEWLSLTVKLNFLMSSSNFLVLGPVAEQEQSMQNEHRF